MAMTTEQVANWMRAHGVSEGVIRDEAAYVASKYADPDENPLSVLAASLPAYTQRSQSSGPRDQGGYNTALPDPAVTVVVASVPYSAPARPAEPVYVPLPTLPPTPPSGGIQIPIPIVTTPPVIWGAVPTTPLAATTPPILATNNGESIVSGTESDVAVPIVPSRIAAPGASGTPAPLLSFLPDSAPSITTQTTEPAWTRGALAGFSQMELVGLAIGVVGLAIALSRK